VNPWYSIFSVPDVEVVMLYRAGDLYPVVGCYIGDNTFTLEEGGDEDGEHRQHPFLAWKPTHWRRLDDDLPAATEEP
jgi:hypothetical protein